ncbi:FCD domain-containing protein [Devosia algicola]|uniref:FCD domain-containing protein n=1 Tax=Devosia algicola TaxID=3026418 RepID=UPI003898D8F0
MLIVAAAGSEVLSDLHEKLLMRMRRIRFACTNDADGWKSALEEHEEMLSALKNRNVEHLTSLLTAHMDRGWMRVRDFVKLEYEQR